MRLARAGWGGSGKVALTASPVGMAPAQRSLRLVSHRFPLRQGNNVAGIIRHHFILRPALAGEIGHAQIPLEGISNRTTFGHINASRPDFEPHQHEFLAIQAGGGQAHITPHLAVAGETDDDIFGVGKIGTRLIGNEIGGSKLRIIRRLDFKAGGKTLRVAYRFYPVPLYDGK